MTVRDKIMDKYWLEFLQDIKGDYSTWVVEYGGFWYWFYNSKMSNNPPTDLKEYL